MKRGRKPKAKNQLKNIKERKQNKKLTSLAKANAREKVAREKWRNTLQKLRDFRQATKIKISKIKMDAKQKVKTAEGKAAAQAMLKALRQQEKRAIAKEKILQKAAMKFEKKYAKKIGKHLQKTMKKPGRRGRPRKSNMAPIQHTPKKRGRPPKHK